MRSLVCCGGATRPLEVQIFAVGFQAEQINHRFFIYFGDGPAETGITMQQANADMDSVTRHIAEVYPKQNKGWGATVEPLQNDFISPETIKKTSGCDGRGGIYFVDRLRERGQSSTRAGTVRQKKRLRCGQLWGDALATVLSVFDGKCCLVDDWRNPGSGPLLGIAWKLM